MRTLAQGKLSVFGLWTFAVVASSPMTVLVGGIPTMYAATGVVGAPLAFLLVGAVLIVLAVGYVTACGHIRHAAPFYALLARGFAAPVGVAGGAVALLGYLAIQTSLYGLIGDSLARMMHAGSWWAWALGVWALVAVLGMLGGLSSARVLGALLVLEIVVILLYVGLAWTDRVGPVTWTPMAPSALLVPGAGGAVAFAIAAFIGPEAVPAYSEEARGRHTVRRATLAAFAVCAVLYALVSWVVAVNAGVDHVVGVSAAALGDPEGPAAALGRVFGYGMTLIAKMLIATSIVAALSSFHGTFARYAFAMARERVLPRVLGKLGQFGDRGSPVAASGLQSALALVVIAVCAVAGWDPVMGMFTWLSTVGAVALLTLLVVAAPASQRFFHGGGGVDTDSLLVRRIAPTIGLVLGIVLMTTMLTNLASLLGLPPGSRRSWLIPALVAVTGLAGLLWGLLIRLFQRDSSTRIGRVVADPATSAVERLKDLVM